jgi:hypothetical protein
MAIICWEFENSVHKNKPHTVGNLEEITKSEWKVISNMKYHIIQCTPVLMLIP